MANKQVSKNGSPLVVTYMLSEVFTRQLNFQVVAVARRIDRLKKLKVEVGETNLFPYKCDLANSNEIKAMIDWIKSTFGGWTICYLFDPSLKLFCGVHNDFLGSKQYDSENCVSTFQTIYSFACAWTVFLNLHLLFC